MLWYFFVHACEAGSREGILARALDHAERGLLALHFAHSLSDVSNARLCIALYRGAPGCSGIC
jgi:hypothetical protein